MGVFVVVGGGMFAEGQSLLSLTDSGVRLRPPFLFSKGSVVSVGRNDYICSRKTHKDPQKVHFVTNFVTHLVSKWVFFLYISQL